MSIKWKQKKTTTNFARFHYAKGGIVLKLKKSRKKTRNMKQVWNLNLSVYSSGIPYTLASQDILVNMNEPKRYYKNLKRNATRTAKTMVTKHRNRLNQFTSAVLDGKL